MSSEILSGPQVAEQGLAGWVYLTGALHTRLRTKDFASALAVVNTIGAAAEEMNHHPDLDLRWGRVDIRLTSHDVMGVTERDLRLARRIDEIAADAGARPDPGSVAVVELALDTPDHREVLPFWRAVLAMKDLADKGVDDELRDPFGALPTLWFQRSGSEEPRQRWHLDVWVEPDQVQPRIDAALAAGGSLVDDAQAPSFWVLADPEGNRMCLCTWQDRH